MKRLLRVMEAVWSGDLEDIPRHTYVRHVGGEGFVIGTNARGEYLISMNKKEADAVKAFPQEILAVWLDGAWKKVK